MAKIWYLSAKSQTLREELPLAWCIDKLWISPRDFRSTTHPRNLKGKSVWVEVTENDARVAPGYKEGFHSCYLSQDEVEERLKSV